MHYYRVLSENILRTDDPLDSSVDVMVRRSVLSLLVDKSESSVKIVESSFEKVIKSVSPAGILLEFPFCCLGRKNVFAATACCCILSF